MKNNRLITLAFPALALALLAACSTPAMRAPDVPVPAGYKEEPGPGNEAWKPAQPAESRERGQWWKVFNDSTLDRLVDQATAANPGLSAAAARVRQARAVAGIVAAERMASLDAQLDVVRERGIAQGNVAATQVQARLAASYEADLFGRISSNVSAAKADAGASEGMYRSVLLALQADVAQSYLRIRSLDAELATLNETVRLRAETVRITRRKHELGGLAETDLARAQTELSLVRADVHALSRQRAQLEHALAVLLGQAPAAFSIPVDPAKVAPVLPGIPAGLPSALLERRPDISAAQMGMTAANARVGAARAARFPSIRLTGEGGAVSGELADVFKWSSRAWAVGVLTSLPLLDGGRARANIERSEAALDEAAASYRHTVLAAFAEVEDNLAGLRSLSGQAHEIGEALGTARRSRLLASKAFEAGNSSYLELLDAQRSLAEVERRAVQLDGERTVATVALIRALGGAW